MARLIAPRADKTHAEALERAERQSAGFQEQFLGAVGEALDVQEKLNQANRKFAELESGKQVAPQRLADRAPTERERTHRDPMTSTPAMRAGADRFTTR